MKKLIFILSISMLVLASCTGVKTVTSGLENEAFLEFIANPDNYKGGVEVLVDDNITFRAEVNKDHADRPKGNVYAISTGKHILVVKYNDNIIFKKQIFVSAQETKKVMLP
ncbi:MAG: hypothetical protein PHD06_01150 [Bacteroidales bacterium]|jgi:hypothetical protein|nr:hypothetical protein [Bacteroidales bacterium]MDD4383763.1 hypothetical protein [Bacteroidales bacterium]MDY0198716.1 hypothetical protein [Tenuifilaceae bacterium]